MPTGVKVLLALALVIVLVAVAGLVYLFNVPRVTVEYVNKSIVQTAPMGKSLPELMKWLEAHPELQRLKEIRDNKTGTVSAIATSIPDVGPRWGQPGRIDVEFQLDKDRLDHVDVKYQKTSIVIGY